MDPGSPISRLEKDFILPRTITVNTYSHSFQYNILNNIWFLNLTLLCSFCNKETPLDIFSQCTYVVDLWQQLATFFKNNLILPALTPDCLAWLWSHNRNYDEPIINHFLLIFKLYVYNSREKHRLNIMDLLTDIKEIKKEYLLSSNSGNKKKIYQNKWRQLMRNYQLRKTNNELTLKKIFFLVNNKWGEVGTVYICI